jgi:hypothetical protein
MPNPALAHLLAHSHLEGWTFQDDIAADQPQERRLIGEYG